MSEKLMVSLLKIWQLYLLKYYIAIQREGGLVFHSERLIDIPSVMLYHSCKSEIHSYHGASYFYTSRKHYIRST
jgi:hypothetical protein